jgi:hypothetical protein
MEIDFLFKEYTKNTHILSKESLDETQEILNHLSDLLRFEYDNFKKLISDSNFNNFAKDYVETGQAKDKKQMVSHLLNVKIQAMSSELKEKFLNLLNVEE